MTANKQERLSALIDGEVTDFERRRLIDELLVNDDDRSQWSRAHLIGDAMRGELPGRISLGFAASVRAQIDQEPELKKRASAPVWLKPTAGFAMAAMVAVVSVLSLQSIVGYEEAPTGLTPMAASTPTPVAPNNANFRLASSPAPEIVKEGVSSNEVQQRINRYLVNHSEFATHPGVLPYARIVGYEQTKE